MSKTIDLYSYQEDLSDRLSWHIPNAESEYVIEKNLLKVYQESYFLTAPLGCGKTRIISRTVKKMIDHPSFEQFKYSFSLFGEEKDFCVTRRSCVLLVVPVSVVPQWVEEMNRWKIDFYLISTPKQNKAFSEIREKVILTSDLRAKEITFGDEESEKYQIYLFIDEYDTMHLTQTFFEKTSDYIKTRVSISSNYDPELNSFLKSRRSNQINYKNRQFVIDKETVDKYISLPEIKEEISLFSLYPILEENFSNFPKDICDKIKLGNISSVFSLYGIYSSCPTLFLPLAFPQQQQQPSLNYKSDIYRLFKNIIYIKERDLLNHLSVKTNDPNGAYPQKAKKQISDLTASLDKYLNFCSGCSEKMSPSDAVTCENCYGFFCWKVCAPKFQSNHCHLCNEVSTLFFAANSSDVIGKVFRSREQAFYNIVQNIKKRDKKEKKILVYCYYPYLVNQLDKFLSTHNYWSIVLKGSSVQRKKLIEQLKKADTDIFLICNSIENSAGIHLPEATDIIIYHELEQHFDTQVVGRAQRIGRDCDLYVHRIKQFEK